MTYCVSAGLRGHSFDGNNIAQVVQTEHCSSLQCGNVSLTNLQVLNAIIK